MEVETLNQIFLKFNYCLYHIKPWGSKKVVVELNADEFKSWEVCLWQGEKWYYRNVENMVPLQSRNFVLYHGFQLGITSDNDSSRKLKGRMVWSDVHFTELLWKA